MSKFAKNLAKGFVRSAVNQVGRDSGRVVSNKTFKDAHSIPIRHTSSKGQSSVNLVTPNIQNRLVHIDEVPEFTREDCEYYGFRKHPVFSTMIKLFMCFSILIPGVGWFAYICFVLAHVVQPIVKYTGVITSNAIISDGRFSTGGREIEINREVTCVFPYSKKEWIEVGKVVMSTVIFGIVIIYIGWRMFGGGSN